MRYMFLLPGFWLEIMAVHNGIYASFQCNNRFWTNKQSPYKRYSPWVSRSFASIFAIFNLT